LRSYYGLKSQHVKIFLEIVAFWIKGPLTVKFQNTVPKVLIATAIDVLSPNFVESGRREIGEIVRCLPDKKAKFRLAFKLSLLGISHPKCPRDSRQQYTQEYYRFNSNWFTFGGVMTERVNTAKLRPKVYNFNIRLEA